MYSKEFLGLCLLLTTIAYPATGDCKFDEDYILTSNRIFLLKDSQGNYKLLIRDSVPTGTIFYLACNEGDTQNIDELFCDGYGNFNTDLPTSECEQPKAFVSILGSEVSGYNEYEVGFVVQQDFARLYRTVYDATSVRALYTIYEMYTDNLKTKRPANYFTCDHIVTSAVAASFKRKSVCALIKKKFVGKHKYCKSPDRNLIDIGHLTPSADFMFCYDKLATNKLINAAPQFSTINNGNWKTIEAWIRGNNGSERVRYRVVTGVYDVLALKNRASRTMTEVYLHEGDKNPIPKWMYKIVEKESHCYVFITYNNIYDKEPPTPICEPIECPIKLKENMQKGYTYCCDVEEFKTNINLILDIC